MLRHLTFTCGKKKTLLSFPNSSTFSNKAFYFDKVRSYSSHQSLKMEETSQKANAEFFDNIKDIQLKSAADGTSCLATDLWKEQKCVVRLFRRLGWRNCASEAAILSPIAPILKENGIRVVGIGTDYGAEEFYKSGVWKGEFFISPHYEIYKRIPNLRKVALGGLGFVFDLKKISEQTKKMKAELGEETFNNLPHNLKGTDPFYGGTFVIGPGNTLHYAHYNKVGLEWAENSEILQACGLDPSLASKKSEN